jgi:hypothetical protein
MLAVQNTAAGLERVYENYTSYMLQDGSRVDIYNGCELDCLKNLSQEHYHNIIRRCINLDIEFKNTARFESVYPAANNKWFGYLDYIKGDIISAKFKGFFYSEGTAIETVFEDSTGLYIRFLRAHINYKAKYYKVGAWYQIQEAGRYWYCDNDFISLFNVRLIK